MIGVNSWKKAAHFPDKYALDGNNARHIDIVLSWILYHRYFAHFLAGKQIHNIGKPNILREKSIF